MEQLIAAVLARNTIELRIISGRILNELKKHSAAGVPAKVVDTSIPAAPAAPKEATAKVAPGPSVERPFGVRCVATGKDLKRAFSDPQLAAQAAADLTAQMGRPYVVTGP